MSDTGRHPSAVYEHRGTPAVQRMVEYAPSTGGLALWIRHVDAAPEGDIDFVTANDGASIFYGPAFDDLPLMVQTGLVAHQVLHVALRHPQRMAELQRLTGDVDPELYNICADAIVNSTLSHLTWLELPDGSVFLEDLLAAALHRTEESPEKALLEWDVERLYRLVDDRRSGSGGTGKRRGGRGGRQDDKGKSSGGEDAEQGRGQPKEDGPRAARVRHVSGHILRDLLPAADAEHPEAEAERSREWHERITRAHAGDGLHSMLRALLADLPKVRTPWEQLLRTQLARGLSMQPELSWSRPSRSYLANRGRVGSRASGRTGSRSGQGTGMRMPWEPGRASSSAVARLAVLVDVSGSVDDTLMHRFAAEVEAISRRLEALVLVVIGDDKVRDVRTFEPGRSNLRDVKFEGRGGTDFTPLLEEAQRHDPDMAVFLTDLDGRVDYCPSFPVLWAVPAEAAHMQAPFGRKLVLE
ncbi:MAG: VWA-like domain-containing protein [Thiohalocapsa sp.]|uniref:vWA domain-containing protein n=1 Tax=Thiohalocapsa sp. TaxID=2497641 RepID=UPI0025FD83B2|nr:VWA-like domain-containing protein [Thiohalocapsa sp.]MCG6939758.1 VWA-like domain-containing protein [Thiohalocapsa sp.]